MPTTDYDLIDDQGNRKYLTSLANLFPNPTSGEFRVDPSSFPKGIYILSFRQSTASATIRVVKE